MPILGPKIQKLVQDEGNSLIREQITPWIMGFAKGRLSINNFYQKNISYEGVLFEGSPRDVFWGRYIEPFLEDTNQRLINSISQECAANNLNLTEELHMLQLHLQSMHNRIFNNMADIDQRMRGGGYPERIPKRDVSEEISRMNNYLCEHIEMEIAKHHSSQNKKIIWKRLWHDPVWSKVRWNNVINTSIYFLVS